MKTTKISLSNLRNEEHIQFQTEVKDLVTLSDAAKLNISEAFAVFLLVYAKENEALQVIRKSANTEQLADADWDRDHIFRGFADAVKSACNHFNPDKHAAATRFDIVLGQYGNVARKPYNDETADIIKLVQEARGAYASDMSLLSLTDWVDELEVKNQAFDTLMKTRFTGDAKKTILRMKQVRIEMDDAYHAIANRLDALMLLNGTETLEPFVRELNTRVDKYNNILAQRKGRGKKDDDTTKKE
jgi:hypothetical protein